jgi:hypothetical protein
VIFPERATLSVVRVDDRTWELGQVTAALNSPVSPATKRLVKEWLAAMN